MDVMMEAPWFHGDADRKRSEANLKAANIVSTNMGPVVRSLCSAVHRINPYPLDKFSTNSILFDPWSMQRFCYYIFFANVFCWREAPCIYRHVQTRRFTPTKTFTKREIIKLLEHKSAKLRPCIFQIINIVLMATLSFLVEWSLSCQEQHKKTQ